MGFKPGTKRAGDATRGCITGSFGLKTGIQSTIGRVVQQIGRAAMDSQDQEHEERRTTCNGNVGNGAGIRIHVLGWATSTD
jgi:hypothetical protein